MDISLPFGGDFSFSATGDLATVSDAAETLERVERRLLTAQGNYIQHTDYGTGIPQMLGQPTRITAIQAIARQQMRKEQGVASIPLPTASATTDNLGGVALTITYADAADPTGPRQSLNLPT